MSQNNILMGCDISRTRHERFPVERSPSGEGVASEKNERVVSREEERDRRGAGG